MRRGVIFVDHGSRREEANHMLETLALAVQGAFSADQQDVAVEAAHMELAEPSLKTAFCRCVERGVLSIIVVPCMISRGRHVSEDIPALLEEAAMEHPGVPYALAAPLSEHAGFASLLRDIAEATAQDLETRAVR